MKASRQSRFIRILIAAVLALLFAGSAVGTMASALGVDTPLWAIYLAALFGVGLCALSAWSGGAAIVAAVLFAMGAGGFVAANLENLPMLRVIFAHWSGESVDAYEALLGARLIVLAAGAGLGLVFFTTLYRWEFVSMSILLLGGLIIYAHAMFPQVSMGRSVPGMIAAAAAFALSGAVQRDRAAARVLIPSALVVCAALLLTPQEPGTWKPMEDAAQWVRSVVEQYFNFARERVAFSINEQGYDHAGEINGSVVGMLGGPAQPKDTPKMRVEADRDVLLRGSIRSTYTGYSWVDLAPKNRYLFMDPTHRAVRARVFNLDLDTSAFEPVDVAVEYLDEGTSTLFTPARTKSFSMDLSNAVYYNASGEMFMARPVEPGDRYSLTALMARSAGALRAAAIGAEGARDGQYADILRDYTALPAGIEPALGELVSDLTADLMSPYEKALAIQDYLRRNMRYTLTPDYPPVGRDFVSYFVLDSREGYCSYYASAMAVMARIAGLPSRYVEGYLARAGATGEAVLTGQDAHAWAEIYFNGLGWVSFDATSGSTGGAAGEEGEPEGPGETPDDESGSGDGQGEGEDPEGGSDPSAGPTPTPTPAPQGDPFGQDPSGPQDSPDDGSDPPRQDDGGKGGAPWALLLALGLLLLIALTALWARERLRRADPARLVGQTRSTQQAAMILYRANLTALAAQGLCPEGGEAPERFAKRVKKETGSADYAAFTGAVAAARYGKKPLSRADIEAGLRAYRTFTGRLRGMAKLRYAMRRVLRGLGSFEQIP